MGFLGGTTIWAVRIMQRSPAFGLLRLQMSGWRHIHAAPSGGAGGSPEGARMARILGWIVDRLRWALAGAVAVGLLMVYWGWSDASRIRDVEANGIEGVAVIEGATRAKRRRGGETYSLKLAWRDAKGEVQRSEKVTVSSTFARQIISADRIVRDSVRIKYPREMTLDSMPIVLEDAARQEETDDFLMKLGAGISALGAIGSGLFFFIGRRRRDVEAPSGV
jgi:hypothetical protein